MTAPRQPIVSADNPALVAVRKLLAQPTAYRKAGQLWLEGDHLLRAALQRGWTLGHLLVDAAQEHHGPLQPLLHAAQRVSVVDSRIWKALSTLDSPPPLGALVALPSATAVQAGLPSVVLDRLQDAGNVGSILRSAAALGVAQVVALKGTAALWSPKVLRAGMGAHFALHLVEAAGLDDLEVLKLPLVATSSHGGVLLPKADLPLPCAWVFGHEGQGVCDGLLARCQVRVMIPQPGGEESLNVAAAAAICLYESARRQGQ
ncbi:rRNA methylase [Burkholderiales bacterium JOSHI_001]|nr:rRNA methylase [Burkholderiales bacterium JOSHI_001]